MESAFRQKQETAKKKTIVVRVIKLKSSRSLYN